MTAMSRWPSAMCSAHSAPVAPKSRSTQVRPEVSAGRPISTEGWSVWAQQREPFVVELHVHQDHRVGEPAAGDAAHGVGTLLAGYRSTS